MKKNEGSYSIRYIFNFLEITFLEDQIVLAVSGDLKQYDFMPSNNWKKNTSYPNIYLSTKSPKSQCGAPHVVHTAMHFI